MRRALPCLASFLLLAAVAQADTAMKGPWDGFGVGTWFHVKSSTTMQIPGVDTPPTVQEMKQTLVKVTDAEYTVRTEVKMGDAWTGASEFPFPRKGTPVEGEVEPKREELGSDKVTVEGKEHGVKKVRITTTVAGTTTTTLSWESAEHGALRSESTSPDGTSSVMEVTSLSKKAKVGDKELTCREMKTTSKMQGGESSMVMLWSDAVPGRVVRNEIASSMGGAKTNVVTELVAYETK
jgi:hypothetical protein